MTIKQLMDGVRVNWMQLTIIEKVTDSKYIVGDNTGIAILEIPEEFCKYLEIGKGIKLVKPGKLDDNIISCDKRFSPMKTKAVKLVKHDQKKIDALKKLIAKTSEKQEDTQFKDIQNSHDNTIITEVLVYVTTVSRPIESKYGCYKICNLRDKSSAAMAINMYAPHVDRLEANAVYTMKKIKKITMKTDGSTRLTTNRYTQIQNGSQEERDVFKNVRVAENTIEGTCVMFTNMSTYNACTKHLIKLDQYLTCAGCQKKLTDEEINIDFHCMVQIEDDADASMKSILVFKRLLKVHVQNNNEEDIGEILEEHLVGKKLKIDYNTPHEDDAVAVKIVVIS